MSYLPGTKINNLEVMAYPMRIGGETIVLCKCVCSKLINVKEVDLIKGAVQSCGCLDEHPMVVQPVMLPNQKIKKLPVGYKCGKYEVVNAERVYYKGQWYVECRCNGCGEVNLVRDWLLKHNRVSGCKRCAKRVS